MKLHGSASSQSRRWSSACLTCCSQHLEAHRGFDSLSLHRRCLICTPFPLTGAAAGRPDAAPPVLPVPLWPHGLDLVHGGGATHAVEAFPRAAMRKGAVGARAVWVEAEPMVGRYERGGLVQRANQVRKGGRGWYERLRAQ